MHKKMTITLDENVYKALYLQVGRRKMSQFIEEAVMRELNSQSLDEQYREMAADQARNQDVAEWNQGLASDDKPTWEW